MKSNFRYILQTNTIITVPSSTCVMETLRNIHCIVNCDVLCSAYEKQQYNDMTPIDNYKDR